MKSEIRSSKSESNPKLEIRIAAFVRLWNFAWTAHPFRISDFGLLSDFGFRYSDFPHHV